MQINQGKRSKFIHIKWLKQKNSNLKYVMMQYFTPLVDYCIRILSYVQGVSHFVKT
jgi:hypothetical protein